MINQCSDEEAEQCVTHVDQTISEANCPALAARSAKKAPAPAAAHDAAAPSKWLIEWLIDCLIDLSIE